MRKQSIEVSRQSPQFFILIVEFILEDEFPCKTKSSCDEFWSDMNVERCRTKTMHGTDKLEKSPQSQSFLGSPTKVRLDLFVSFKFRQVFHLRTRDLFRRSDE